MNKILTIVIPTYNMEKYLESCLKSFIFNEKEQRLEVLIVNDGSRDNSLKIAKTYEKLYPNIFKVIDKPNGGHGSTINAGLEIATGKYFKVVDADDWVEPEMLKWLCDKLETIDIDCVVCNYDRVFEETNKIQHINCQMSTYDSIHSIDEAREFKFVMAATTFKTKLIKDIKIDEKCFYVDEEYNLFSILKCQTFINYDVYLYKYRVGRIGQSISEKGFFNHRFDHLKVVKAIIEKNPKEPIDIINNNCINIIRSHYDVYSIIYGIDRSVVTELIEFDNFLKNYPDLYKRTNEIRKIRNLRKKNFRNIAFYNRLFKMKQFVKKILGRA